MNKDIILLRTTEVAAIASYKYIGRKNKNKVDKAAVEAFEVMLKDELNFKLKIVNGEGELDKAPMLYSGQILGSGDDKTPIFDASIDPIEGTYPAAYNFGGSISVISISRENTMKKLPEMYMEKVFISKEFVNKVNINQDILKIVKEMIIIRSDRKLKCIILDKPRHQDLIEKLSKDGIIVRLIQDGDVLGAIDVVNEQADFVYGIGGAPEGVLMASLAISSGAKFISKLVPYASIWPNNEETEQRTKIETKFMIENKISFEDYFLDTDLVNDSKTRFFASGVTAGGSLKPVDYVDGKFIVNSFMSSHGIVRNIISKYDVNTINELKPEVKYLLDKYKR